MNTDQAEELYNIIHKDLVVYFFEDFKQIRRRRMLCMYNIASFEDATEYHGFDTDKALTFVQTFSGETFFVEVSYVRFQFMHKKAFLSKLVDPSVQQQKQSDEPGGPLFSFYNLDK